MATQAKHVPLSGSHRNAVPGSSVIGPAHPHERIEVTVRLRPRAPIPQAVKLEATAARSSATERRYLTREQLAADHGASAEDIAKVVAFAKAHHLAVVADQRGAEERLACRNGRRLERGLRRHARRVRPSPTAVPSAAAPAPILIPADLEGIVVGVFGLDNRPQAQPHFRIRKHRSRTSRRPRRRQHAVHAAPDRPALRLPRESRRHGRVHRDHRAGRWIQDGRPEDLLFQPGPAAPTVTSVSVDGGTNTPDR